MTPLLRFLPRHLADHLITRGAVMFAIGVVMTLPVVLGSSPASDVPLRRLTTEFLGGVTPFLTLVATYGIIEQDVRQGYYRFLLSKPVSPVRYYAASFAVSLVSFLVVILLLIGVVAVLREPVWPGVQAIADYSFTFLLLGGLIFAFSRFTRADWVFGIVLLLIGAAARTRWPPGESAFGTVLNIVLPPDPPSTHFPLGAADWSDIAWTLGYAAIAFTAGLLAVRFVPFGERR